MEETEWRIAMRKLYTLIILLALGMTGCTTTDNQFGQRCIYDPDLTPAFHCGGIDPGRNWV